MGGPNTTPGDDRGRELTEALDQLHPVLVQGLDQQHEDAEALRTVMFAAQAHLRALAAPAETEAGATDPGWGEDGCPDCGQQIEYVRAEHTRMEWEDGARWPQPCPGSFVQVAAAPPTPEGEAWDRPQRGGPVEAWLKARRDAHDRGDSSEARALWSVLDDALDDLRSRADVGAPWSGRMVDHGDGRESHEPEDDLFGAVPSGGGTQ